MGDTPRRRGCATEEDGERTLSFWFAVCIFGDEYEELSLHQHREHVRVLLLWVSLVE